jgi:Leucine-rich repeat (LRR) protein
MFLFDRKTLRHFRKDGHNWRKKKDGKTIREAHERLKTGSVDVLHCYYAHGEDNSCFQRRCYWLLDPVLEHIVLVHYREVTESSRFSTMAADTTTTHSSSSPSSTVTVAGSPDVSGVGPSEQEHEDGDVVESDEVEDSSSSSLLDFGLATPIQQQQPSSLLEQIAPPPPPPPSPPPGMPLGLDTKVFHPWGAPPPPPLSSSASPASSAGLVGIEKLSNSSSSSSSSGVAPSSTSFFSQLNRQQQQPSLLRMDYLGRSQQHESTGGLPDLLNNNNPDPFLGGELLPRIQPSSTTFDITGWSELLENSQRNHAASKNINQNIAASGMMVGEAVYVKQESMNGSAWDMLEQCITPSTQRNIVESIMANSSSVEGDRGGLEVAANGQDLTFGSLIPSPKGILEALSPRGLGREPQTPLEASLRAVTEEKALRAAAEAQQRRFAGGSTHSDPQNADALWDAKAAEVAFSKLESFKNSELGNLPKFDSFGRWMINELGRDGQNFLPSGPSQSAWSGMGPLEDQGVYDMYSFSQQMQVETGLSTPVSQDQRYSIVDFSPEWAYPAGDAKVIITGMFLREYKSSSEDYKWCCMFGELEVPAEVIGPGVLRCKAPPHALGRVPFYVTCGDRQAHSEIREFEYCSAASTAVGLAATKSGLQTDEEMMLKVRLARMLLAESSTQDSGMEALPGTAEILNSVYSDDEWSYLEHLAKSSGDLQAFNFQEQLLQMLLKKHMQKWLLSKVQEDGKGPSILDEQGQGVFHMAAALGYDWAVAPLVAAGIPINFRDVHGWTALHWAASHSREEVVIALLKARADPGTVTDPTRAFPAGQTPADLAAANGHGGIAGFLAEANLIGRLSSMTISENPMDIAMSHIAGEKAVAKLSRRDSIRRSMNGGEDELSVVESLQAVRNAAQVAALINAAFQRHSFQKQEEDSLASIEADEFGMTPRQSRGLMAARTAQKFQNAFRGHHEKKQQLAATLQLLNLSGCSELKELLTSIDKLTHLESLDLSRCSELKELSTSIGKLTTLRLLDLLGCSWLKELLTSIDKLTTLGSLDLSRCSWLKELPTSIDKLTTLGSLNLSGCSELKELPTSIGKLTTLRSLDLSGCSQLKELPTSIDKLTTLGLLNLSGCSELKELPTSIGKLTTLRLLDLSGCSRLKELPTSIDKLTILGSLNLSGCSELKELPTSIGKLTTLRSLDLSGCSQLKELPTSIDKLISLEKLDLSRCSELKELSTSIDKLIGLRSLDLSLCLKSKELLMASASIHHVPNVERSDAASSSIDFELGGNVGVGTLQSQATSKFAKHSTILRISEVFDKVITNAQQLLDSQNGGNSIKVVGRQDKTADAYEFFFQSAKCMSKVVGVGLEWAKVLVSMECGTVEVWSINESAWQKPWDQVEEDVVVLNIDLSNIRKEGRNIYNLTAEEASKKFGVGVHPQGPHYNHGGVNAFFVEEKRKDVAFYPLIWELAHYMAWNCKQHAGSEPRNNGARSLWGFWGPTTSSQSPGSSSNNQAGDDAVDNSGAPANLCDVFSNATIDPKKDKTLIVTVHLGKESILNPQNMAESQLDDRIKTASISPMLEFKFELLQGDTIRKITIETHTKCHLGDSAPESKDRGYLGYYQDDITISLSCTGKKGDGSEAAELLSPVTVLNSKDKTRSESDTYGKSESCARQKSGQITGQVTVNPMHMVTFGGTIQGGQNQTNTSGDSTSHASTSEVNNARCVSGYVLNCMEQEASWKCKFFSEHTVLDYVKQGDDGAYKRLYSSGIFNTFWPSIVSVWGSLDDNEACPYEFKTKRDIISIQDEIKRRSIQDHARTPAFVPTPEPKLQHSWHFWSKKRKLAASQDTPVPDIMVMGPEISTESQNLQQVYEKTMCVNIAMTHVIHEYKQLELRGQENNPDTGITIGVQGPPQVNAETG